MILAQLILAVSLVAPQAQSVPVKAVGAETPRDLVVSSFYWGRIDKTVIHHVRPRMDRFGRVRRPIGAPPPTVILQRETYALVRNTGDRTVKAVTWSYTFYNNSNHDEVVRQHEFRTKEKLEPGEMKFLTERVDDEAPTSWGEVKIERIEFEDGSVWERGDAD